MTDFKLIVRPKSSFIFSIFTLIPSLFLGLISLAFIILPAYVLIAKEFVWLLFLPMCMGIFGMVGALSLSKIMIWGNFGREIIIIDNGFLTVKRRFAIGIKNEKVALSEIRNLRIIDLPSYEFLENIPFLHLSRAIYAPALGGRVGFDAGNKTIYVGNFLDFPAAEKLLHEIECKSTKTSELVDVSKTEFPRIKSIVKQDKRIFSYSPKKDLMLIIAFTAAWIIFTSIAVINFTQSIESVNSFISSSGETLLKMYALPVASLLLLFSVLHFLFGKEKLDISKSELKIKNPFNLSIRRKIDLNTINHIALQDKIILKRYWSVGKGKEHQTYVAKLGDRIVITTNKKTYKLGRGLSFPEGQYIVNEIEKKDN